MFCSELYKQFKFILNPGVCGEILRQLVLCDREFSSLHEYPDRILPFTRLEMQDKAADNCHLEFYIIQIPLPVSEGLPYKICQLPSRMG